MFTENNNKINLAFIGAVNNGKSTISSALLVQSNAIDDRTLNKLDKNINGEIKFAHLLDTDKYEQKTGNTIEYAMDCFSTSRKVVSIFDCPGHSMYISSTIEGIAQADVCVLIVSARTGEFESGFEKSDSTRDHMVIAKAQNVGKMVVLINKMDDKTVLWKEARFLEIVKKIEKTLKIYGYKSEDIHFMPVSGLLRMNLNTPIPKEICSWWQGETFFDYLDNLNVSSKSEMKSLRIPIFESRNMGLRQTEGFAGRIESGTLSVNDEVLIMPQKWIKQVSEIEIDNVLVKSAECGSNIVVSFKGKDHESITKGCVISSVDNPVKVCQEFMANVKIYQMPPDKNIICNQFSCTLHLHSISLDCTFIKLGTKGVKLNQDKLTNTDVKKSDAKFLLVGDSCECVMRLSKAVALEKFSTMARLGTFILRSDSTTIGFGRIVKIKEIAL